MQRHKIVPPIYFLTTLLAMAVVHRMFPLPVVLPAPYNLLGWVLVVVGVACTFWGAGLFRRVGTPIRPFETSTRLVTTGIYRFTRNPMYLGMALVLLGAAALFGTLLPFVFVALFVWQIQRKFVQPEEHFLENLFGQEYLAYKSRVRRWL